MPEVHCRSIVTDTRGVADAFPVLWISSFVTIWDGADRFRIEWLVAVVAVAGFAGSGALR